MKKFEYKVISIATNIVLSKKQYDNVAKEFETKLNELGTDGWEFIQRIDGLFFFKREIE